MNNKSPYNPAIHHRRSIRLKGYDYTKAGLYFITLCCQDRICRFGHIVGAGFTPAPDERPAPGKGNREGCPNSCREGCPNSCREGCPNDFSNATSIPDSQPAPARMVLNEFGEIAYREWVKLPERFPTVELDVFQIMPNHMHGIIILTESTGDGVGDGRVRVNRTPTVGNDVGATVGATLAATVGATLAATVGATLAATVGATVGATLAVALSGDGRARFTRAPTVGDIVGAYKSLVANACLAMYQSKNETMGKLWQRNYYEHIIRHESAYHNISNYIIHNPSHWIEDRFYF